MSLQLVPMGIHAPKIIPPAVHIQHDPLPRIARALPRLIIRPHLDPLRRHLAPGPPPLPPRLPADALDAAGAQLRLHDGRGAREVRLGDARLVQLDPARARHPLRGEALDVLDGVVRGVGQELGHQLQPLVVGDVRRGFLREPFPAEVLIGDGQLVQEADGQWRTYVGEEGLDHGGCHDAGDGGGIEHHLDALVSVGFPPAMNQCRRACF